MQIILAPFSWLITIFYNIFQNYGLALILFALLVKLILFPLSIKGKRSMIQMNMLNGKMQKLQKMYGNNKERYNQELQKLYEKEHVNPMSGCLWSLLPVIILIPLYYLVREPLTYMMNLTGDQINALLGALPETIDKSKNFYYQLTAADVLSKNFGAVVKNPAVAEFADKLLRIDFNFLGLNLNQTPNWKVWTDWASIGLFLVPVVSAATSVLMSVVSTRTNSVNTQSEEGAKKNGNSKMLLLLSPVLSLWIGYNMPASMSIYWIAQNVISVALEILASRMLKKDYEKAAEELARREAEEKEEEKRRREEERAERARRIEEAKQNKGKKGAKKQKDDEDIPAAVKEASRVGIRAYARGRAYDPYRFSSDGPTPYREDTAGKQDKK